MLCFQHARPRRMASPAPAAALAAAAPSTEGSGSTSAWAPARECRAELVGRKASWRGGGLIEWRRRKFLETSAPMIFFNVASTSLQVAVERMTVRPSPGARWDELTKTLRSPRQASRSAQGFSQRRSSPRGLVPRTGVGKGARPSASDGSGGAVMRVIGAVELRTRTQCEKPSADVPRNWSRSGFPARSLPKRAR